MTAAFDKVSPNNESITINLNGQSTRFRKFLPYFFSFVEEKIFW